MILQQKVAISHIVQVAIAVIVVVAGNKKYPNPCIMNMKFTACLAVAVLVAVVYCLEYLHISLVGKQMQLQLSVLFLFFGFS